MKTLSSEIEIDASAKQVWRILTDIDEYPAWNPFIRKLTGVLAVGERITVRIEPPDGSGMTFRPKLLAVEPDSELRWLGHLFIPGIFDGEHIFRIEPLAGDRVRFIHQESFRGILVPLMARMLDNNTLRGFEAMNRALKERAETLLAHP